MSRIANLEATYALFGALTDGAVGELKETLGKIADAVLREQQALAPVRTGDLKASLTIKEELERLRVRIGIFGKAAVSKTTRNRLARERREGKPARKAIDFGSSFYALIIEYGRKAQDVWVTRGTTASTKSATSRRKHNQPGGLRKPYRMHITALAPRPFVNIDNRILAVADGYLARFWNRVTGGIEG